MRSVSFADTIDVRPAGVPPSDLAHRPFLIASVTLASGAGFVLAIFVPLSRLLDFTSDSRVAELVHAHGQLQLLGFAGLFVMGMSLRLMPRFAGARTAFVPLVPTSLYLVAAGLVAAFVAPWLPGDLRNVVSLASIYAVLLGSACFLLITAGTLLIEARRFEASSLAFIMGASMLFLAGLVSAFAAIDGQSSVGTGLPYLARAAVLHLELFGFLASFILGVALRALPAMVGISRPGRSAFLLAALLAGSVALVAGSFLCLEYVSQAKVFVFLADGGFLMLGLILLSLVWQTGVLREAANRIRPASRAHLWLVRSAMVWLVVAGLLGVYFGASSLIEARLPGVLELDAVRHAMGVGVITNLIVGMSLMILPEFAAERLTVNRQTPLAVALCLLLNSAAILRIVPSLAGASLPADARNAAMASAGLLAEAALLIFAGYLLRLLWRSARNQGG